jgi:hypothetical protein
MIGGGNPVGERRRFDPTDLSTAGHDRIPVTGGELVDRFLRQRGMPSTVGTIDERPERLRKGGLSIR